MEDITFSDRQYQRYQRHLSLPHFGAEGQRLLLGGSVLLVGAGGLGSPIALYLAAAGVGRIGIVDADVVDLSNLQRQILYTTVDVGRPKVEAARDRLLQLNPEILIETFFERLSPENARKRVSDYDVIIDGTDNFPTRYLINDTCVALGKPYVSGAIMHFEGQVSVYDARRGACYRCLFPEAPPPDLAPSCAEAGVLGVLPGIVAMVQATEAIKLLASFGESLQGRLLRYDAFRMEFSELRVNQNPDCRVCGDAPRPIDPAEYASACGIESPPEIAEVSATELRDLMRGENPPLLLDVREAQEVRQSRIEGSTHIPLADLPLRLAELESRMDQSVVVHCHRGARSLRAAEILVGAGFTEVSNLSGGIEAWSLTVDHEVPRYA